MYTRATGSVPDSRTRIQEPSSKINLIPSIAFTDATRRPATDSGGVRFFSASRMRASAESSRSIRRVRNGPMSFQSSDRSCPMRLAGRPDELGREQVREDPVLFRDVALDGQARALLPAEDDLSVEQKLADVLEPDGRLVERDPGPGGDRVERVRRRHTPGDAAPPALAAEEVRGQEGQDLVRLHVRARLVEDAEAVGVAVAREAEAGAARPDDLGELRELGLAALRRLAAEERVRVGVEARERGAGRLEPGVEEPGRGPEAEVEAEARNAAADVAAGDLRSEVHQVRGRRIEARDDVLGRGRLSRESRGSPPRSSS